MSSSGEITAINELIISSKPKYIISSALNWIKTILLHLAPSGLISTSIVICHGLLAFLHKFIVLVKALKLPSLATFLYSKEYNSTTTTFAILIGKSHSILAISFAFRFLFKIPITTYTVKYSLSISPNSILVKRLNYFYKKRRNRVVMISLD